MAAYKTLKNMYFNINSMFKIKNLSFKSMK